MKRTLLARVSVALALSASAALAQPVGDPEAGQKAFRQCASCHMVGEGAKKRVGPVLNGILGAPAARAEDFRYSAALADAAAEGLIWDAATLDAFLANPREYLRGNRMSFRGVRDDQTRADLIAYIAQFSADGQGAEASEGFAVAPEVLAIEGDVEYGEYLSSECKTCHQSNGAESGIPNITGLASDDFVTAMHAYRAEFRENPVMQLVAKRLSDEEIAALAAYFKDLEN